MAVSKRTRYEVLKRDNHTCRYCGGTAPDVVLTVDHVTPVALGGSDDPSNLVAACRDCNAGKASTSPDAAVVEDVKQLDLQWSKAIARVAATRSRHRRKRQVYTDRFADGWAKYGWGSEQQFDIPKPSGWETTIERFYDLGVPIEELEHLIRVACTNRRVDPDECFRYFAGCCWRSVTEMQEAAKALLESEASDGP